MPEARSESNSESNKKNLGCTLVHFLRSKNRRYTKSVLITFMYHLIAHLIIKILYFNSVNS
jgi:hypothetical protein